MNEKRRSEIQYFLSVGDKMSLREYYQKYSIGYQKFLIGEVIKMNNYDLLQFIIGPCVLEWHVVLAADKGSEEIFDKLFTIWRNQTPIPRDPFPIVKYLAEKELFSKYVKLIETDDSYNILLHTLLNQKQKNVQPEVEPPGPRSGFCLIC